MKLPPFFDPTARALLRERWGWPGALSLLALAAAALLAFGLAPRWSAQAQAQLAAFEQATTRADRQRAASASALPPSARLAWPAAEQTPERVTNLMRLAAPAGLRVVRSSEQAAAGGHLQLSLSALGSYSAIRSYLSWALVADPALVLQQLRLQREDNAAAPLRVEMRWVLLQDAGAPAQPRATP